MARINTGFTFQKSYGEKASYKFSVDFLTTSWNNPVGIIESPQEINSNPVAGTINVAGTIVTLAASDILSPQHVIDKLLITTIVGWTVQESYESYTLIITKTTTGPVVRPDVVLDTAKNILFVDKGFVQGSLIGVDPLDDLKISGIFPIQVTFTYTDGSPILYSSSGTDVEQAAGTLVYSPVTLTNKQVIITTPCTYLRVGTGGTTSVDIKINRYTIPVSGGGGVAETYTNASPSVITVGGISSGTTFLNQTMTNMFDMMLYPELFPTLTGPSNTFSLPLGGLHEIGEVIPTLTFNSTFSRGSISPAYGTNGFRSGLPSSYIFTGTGITTPKVSTALTDTETVSAYTVLSGARSWTSAVSYSIGTQPLSSKGNNYLTPLPAGTTSAQTVSITGVYPTFAVTATLGTLTKQPLALMNSVYIQTNVVAEDGSINKQMVEFPTVWSVITGIQFYNTVNSTWEYIGGSKANSLLTFTISSVTNTIQSSVINYNRYTHNGSTIGARMLRWYTT